MSDLSQYKITIATGDDITLGHTLVVAPIAYRLVHFVHGYILVQW
jgi:hypothetical protein